MDSEILHWYRAGHLTNVRQVLFIQTGGRAGHAPGLAIQSEETCRRRSSPPCCGSDAQLCVKSSGHGHPQARVGMPGEESTTPPPHQAVLLENSHYGSREARLFARDLQNIADELPGQGESSQCLMCKIFSSLDLAWASSQILSYLAISS